MDIKGSLLTILLIMSSGSEVNMHENKSAFNIEKLAD